MSIVDEMRDRLQNPVENILDPQSPAIALLAILDWCDDVSVGTSGPNLMGQALAAEIRAKIAMALGMVEPL